MIEVPYEYVTVEGLRVESRRRRIPVDGKDREELIAQIQEDQVRQSSRRNTWSLPFALSVMTLAVMFIAAIGTLWQANATVGLLSAELAKTNREIERAERSEWQEFIVFSIIDKRFADSKFELGVSFDDIQAVYLDEAKMVQDIALGQDDLQPMALKKILMSLVRDDLVYRTSDGKYGTQSSALITGFGRSDAMQRASYDIVFVLSTESGRIDDQQLQTRMIDRFQLTPQEYRWLITFMVKEGYVVRDDRGQFYSASVPPP